MEFKAAADLVKRLKQRQVTDAKAGHTRSPTDLELEAAAMIDSLLFQLNSRIEKETKA